MCFCNGPGRRNLPPVQQVMPGAVTRGSDGYLRVDYEKLGLKFQSYDQWIEGAQKTGLTPLRR